MLTPKRLVRFQYKETMTSNNPPGAGETQPREIKVLETAEDIQQRRDEVLTRYAAFKQACSDRKALLEDSRRYQYFKRDADELESWILEKLQTASDENYKDPTNLQVSERLLTFFFPNRVQIHRYIWVVV